MLSVIPGLMVIVGISLVIVSVLDTVLSLLGWLIEFVRQFFTDTWYSTETRFPSNLLFGVLGLILIVTGVLLLKVT